MSKLTISERLFEQFCSDNDIRFTRIETESDAGNLTPDYEIEGPGGGQRISVEIKQFDPTPEDRKLQRQLEERKYTDVFGGEPGAKVRLKIQSGAKQLKARTEGKEPGILVLYNNVPIHARGIDSYEIKTAMYGIEKLTVDVGGDETSLLDRGFGPKRKTTPNSNTSLSAVAVLKEAGDALVLLVFHNVHAANPMEPAWLPSSNIAHFTLEEKLQGEYQDWVALEGH